MSITSQQLQKLHREAPLTDVHGHPSLKAFLFNRNLWRHYCSGSVFNPFASRTDFKMLEKGGLQVQWLAHYLPERQLFKQCFWFRLAAFLATPAYFKMTRGSLMNRLLQMMDRMEREINRKPDRTELARSVADIQRIHEQGKIAFIHTVEGAHVLEGNLENLTTLAQRGVALITLAHFFYNGLVPQVNAIPKNFLINKICKYDFMARGHPELSDFGTEVVRKMHELRMIIDVSHCTPEARAAIFAENQAAQPIVATHVGVHKINPDPYNLENEEIQEIVHSQGAVGVIFMNYWLDPRDPKKGLDALWRTIEHLHQVTQSWDYIMLGTDFDGFTDPPDDVKDTSQLPSVTRMLLERGLSEVEIKKILGANAMRVLKAGWK